MALDTRQKNRFRYVLRLTMIAVALLLLFFAVVLPIVNNAVALGVENDLKELPLPEQTELLDSISAANRFTPLTHDIQYFGAILVKSSLPAETVEQYYESRYDCKVEPQTTAEIAPVGVPSHVTLDLSFDQTPGEGCYIVYAWGDVPEWIQDLLNMDTR